MLTATAAPLRETVSLDLLVPIGNNDGVPFSEAQFEAFERRVVALTGGITRRADVEGSRIMHVAMRPRPLRHPAGRAR